MKFYKYYASGNDFIVFADRTKKERGELAKILCDRHEGIGADGFIAVMPHEKYDFEWDFYNCDGSKANMCGNGSRVAAHFAHHILKKSQYLNFMTGAGLIKSHVNGDDVEVALTEAKTSKRTFEYKNRIWQECNTGVSHLVTFVDDLEEFDVDICKELRKKYNANVNFAKVENDEFMRVRTFEKGVEAETLACGTGMAACFCLACSKSLIKNEVKVSPKSGENVFFHLEDKQIFFRGKVRLCFEADYIFAW